MSPSKTLPLGLIVRFDEPHEVTDALIGVLNDFEPERAGRYRAIANAFHESHQDYAHQAMIPTLLRRLNRVAPPFACVGYHPVHADEIGVWVDLAALHAAEQKGRLIQSSSPDIKTRATYILQVGERVRLLRRKGLATIWETS